MRRLKLLLVLMLLKNPSWVLLGVRCCAELVWGIIPPVPPDYYCPHAYMGKLRHRE